MKRNIDLRNKMKEKKVFQYEVAEKLGVTEVTLIRWLRKELSDSERNRVIKAIETVADQKED